MTDAERREMLMLEDKQNGEPLTRPEKIRLLALQKKWLADNITAAN